MVVLGIHLAEAGAASPLDRFQPSCRLDFSDRLEAPAGDRGFVFAGSDGHFYCADGTRLRLWGVNIAKDSVWQPHETIDHVADLFAQAGLNLVRLHHFDEALLPPDRAGQPERMDPTVLDRLDYWIYACKRRGLYVFIDLLDYRVFSAAEGVEAADKLGRAAKPVAVYNEKLISLQMDYARDLLARHVNPYTGLRYRDDPAICLIEICDEHGMFAAHNRWGDIPSPYREELIRRWNFWLRGRYGTTTALAAAWKNSAGSALGPTERLEDGTVGLPGISPDVVNERVRQPDLRRFCASIERDYLGQMVAYLRSLGVRVPLTAVTQPDSPASVLAAADSLDCLAANYYFGHPIYKTTYPPGVRFTYEAGDALAASGPDTAVRRLSGPKVAGKPLVIREWNVCWPNPNRAAGLLEVAALAARQDVDAMILFSFYAQPEATIVSPFDVSNDPSAWGVMALAGEIFRDAGLRASAPRLAVLWGSTGLYNYVSGAMAGPLYDVARELTVRNWLPGHTEQAADLYAALGAGATDLLPPGTPAVKVIARDSQAPALDKLRALVDGRLPPHNPVRYESGGDLIRIEGAQVQALAGSVKQEVRSSDGRLAWTSATPRAALVWLSRDGGGPDTARSWFAKMVTGAWNTGEQTEPHYRTDAVNLFRLLEPGTAPVHTGGKPSDTPTILRLNGQPVLQLGLRGGTWELHQIDGKRRLYCDTPGVRFDLPDAMGTPVASVPGNSLHPLSGPPWIYPAGAEWVEVMVEPGGTQP